MKFCRITHQIQSGPDPFDKSRFITTFLTILGVTEILYSFRLVLEGKTGKEIPESSRLEFLEKFSANNFALSDAEDNTSESLNRGVIADLSLLRTPLGIRQKSWPNFWEVMDSFLQVEEPFCNNYYFRIILMVQTKKVISMNYGNSASS